MRRRRGLSHVLNLALFTASALLVPAVSASAEPAAPAPPPAREPGHAANTTDPAERDRVLGRGWRQSTDRAWTTSGDGDGFHVLVADAATGYTWRTAATLSEPGFDADLWVGNACVTESGKRAVVVYAPRLFTNRDELAGRGGFSATVDLDTGEVTKLPVRSSLAYFNPGCGTGERAVFTEEGSDLGRTRLTALDVNAGEPAKPVEVEGQVTSAVPTAAGLVAAAGSTLVRIGENGERTRLANATGSPFMLRPDADGGVVFLERLGEDVRVRRALPTDPKAAVATLATGRVKELGVTAGRAGSVFLTGKAEKVGALPPSVSTVDVPRDAQLSTEGRAAVETSGYADAPGEDPAAARRAKLELKVLGTGEKVGFTVDPAEVLGERSAGGRAPHPKSGAPRGEVSATTDLTDPVDAERTCAIPRGDAAGMATQPTPLQAEWAADRAVLGTLENTDGAQAMFPSLPLLGGEKVPPQILLGVMAQESNLWQAARYALPGVTSNPLIGNYFGLAIYNKDGSDDWAIHWDKADCGYGITQVTDGMRMAGREGEHAGALPANQQRAIALDHKTNIAHGLNILQKKWNETRAAGMTVNNGSPRRIENWFFAVWAYNSGFNAKKDDTSPWGVGWTNNPINPRYPANRLPFLEFTQADAKYPQRWPYPEKVMGWAAHSIATTTGAGFAPAWWNRAGDNGNLNRENVKPPIDLFCKPQNDCYPGQTWVPDDPSVLPQPGDDPEPPGPCDHKNPLTGKRDLKCWWHQPATWKPDCDETCGYWNFTFDVEPPPMWGGNYPPRCAQDTLPANALIIDDLPQTPTSLPTKWADPVRRCARDWTNQGTFGLEFANPAAKIDFHQIGAGFDNHFWFGHTRRNDPAGNLSKVTGTWTLNRPLTGWARVLVHIPDHGAHTRQARYEVETGSGVKHRVILQRTERNKWVSLGVMQFSGTPKVRLSSTTLDGEGTEDIAWDAVAFQPMAQKPANVIVSLGDSFSSGEGSGGNDAYYRESNIDGSVPGLRNACHRSPHTWSRQGRLAMHSGNTIGQIADFYNDPTTDHQLLACSGARAYNILPNASVPPGVPKPGDAWQNQGSGQYNEVPQLDRGFVDEATTLVTLSIGGNDARFATILGACLKFIAQCPDKVLDEDNGVPLKDAQPALIRDKVVPSVATTIREVHRMAPNAKIVLMGYPKLMEYGGQCLTLFGARTIDWFAEVANVLTVGYTSMTIDLRAEGIPMVFADPYTAFNGKGACGSPELINPIVAGRTDGDPPITESPVSAESFHPKREGYQVYGDVFTDALRRLGL
ncbi:GDSL-type esterase/lipase family protein [Actinosynnema sp. NPDC047251]|uniref:NocE n=1 Tax=Saccharothrix espanaensis (strain ATCC 51144 / DSM 44229 / JCM 9112 / NBRC 15066 / NRRL 15764) TaxID=1179773 RepID=K0K5Y3_SACES|nr:GDSL-type esterase/lipase family protein [Saccharothrix espanaensis]CCH35670.1 NocE [Saccharothrix espanaensis DSM 44229]